MSGGDLCLGDIARAFAVLRPADADARWQIVRALGFEPGAAAAEVPAAAPTPPAAPPAVEPADPPRPVDDAVSPPKPVASDTSGALPRLVGRPDPHRPPWLSVDSPRLPPQDAASTRARLPLEPLFKPAWTRGIVAAALATMAEDGAIDVDRMILDLARARPLRHVPRRRVPILRHGLHIVLDKREAMNPFMRDQEHLIESVRRIAGREATIVFDMARTPLRVRRNGTLKGWADYVPPQAGTPVLLVSDLGIGQPLFASDIVPDRDWRAFADLLRRAGCPVIAFVPYPRARWPEDLVDHVRIVVWDRRTSAAVAARAARGGGR